MVDFLLRLIHYIVSRKERKEEGEEGTAGRAKNNNTMEEGEGDITKMVVVGAASSNSEADSAMSQVDMYWIPQPRDALEPVPNWVKCRTVVMDSKPF